MNFLRRLVVACAVFLPLLASGQEPPPDGPVSYQVFYDGLVGSGRWVTISGYGSCWQPAGVAADWAPYADGNWAYTEDGWTWVSDEPWGWVVYHYGRWIYLPDDGWFWVPGYAWGPAWVRWRYGGGYCGWAPLPPPNVAVDARWYNICRTRDIGTANLRGVILGRDGNAAYLGQTDHGFHRNGPALDEVNDNAFRKVPRLSLHRNAGPVPAAPRQVGGDLHVYAPEVEPPATAGAWRPRPAPRSPGAPSRHDDHGDRGNAGNQGNGGSRPGGHDDHGGSRPAPAPAPRSAPAPAPAPPTGGAHPAGGTTPSWLH